MNSAPFTFEGLRTLETRIRNLDTDAAYLIVWDRTDSRQEENLARFDLDPAFAQRYLTRRESPTPGIDFSESESDEEDEQPDDSGDEDPDYTDSNQDSNEDSDQDSNEDTDPGEEGGTSALASSLAGPVHERTLNHAEILEVACRWLRDIAIQNTIGAPWCRFRLKAYGPKGVTTLHTGTFVCRNRRQTQREKREASAGSDGKARPTGSYLNSHRTNGSHANSHPTNGSYTSSHPLNGPFSTACPTSDANDTSADDHSTVAFSPAGGHAWPPDGGSGGHRPPSNGISPFAHVSFSPAGFPSGPFGAGVDSRYPGAVAPTESRWSDSAARSEPWSDSAARSGPWSGHSSGPGQWSDPASSPESSFHSLASPHQRAPAHAGYSGFSSHPGQGGPPTHAGYAGPPANVGVVESSAHTGSGGPPMHASQMRPPMHIVPSGQLPYQVPAPVYFASPAFDEAAMVGLARAVKSLGGYYADWGQLVLGGAGHLQGINDAMNTKLHQQLKESRDQVEQLLAAILNLHADQMKATQTTRETSQRNDTRNALARETLNQLGETARVLFSGQGVTPEMGEVVRLLSASPKLMATVKDPAVRELLQDPAHLQMLAELLEHCAQQHRASKAGQGQNQAQSPPGMNPGQATANPAGYASPPGMNPGQATANPAGCASPPGMNPGQATANPTSCASPPGMIPGQAMVGQAVYPPPADTMPGRGWSTHEVAGSEPLRQEVPPPHRRAQDCAK